jgi:hypothetical protein
LAQDVSLAEETFTEKAALEDRTLGYWFLKWSLVAGDRRRKRFFNTTDKYCGDNVFGAGTRSALFGIKLEGR